ncbi:competence type IV pilus ATPase ComGA [Bacillus sp. FJAT-50079]|uniref:competence type IV pilus ATPase ComGA n=1 Tax=Bacillus sp. FJAT-50079 TaxID=2833577 RepID=UPI001BC8EBB0|nr:competence type IV pilus ATPase ComGA [Bacillus sp. FJAT-50079]MBS4209607.1 type II/IV secretion system protein [Bacillus sp. FJAT-50079]
MSIEKIADQILSHALYLEATDIHLTPRKHDYLVQFRLQGSLATIKMVPPKSGERLISHLKFMASIDISEKRKPQSGSLQMAISGRPTALRISTLPTALFRESLVIRILPQDQSISLQKLALFPSAMTTLTSLMDHPFGLLLFTGPTGSGKSSTMYALAEYCAQQLQRKIVTIEDPVEKQNDLFLQVQLNEKAGITYQTGLKAILRHDPDVILIGEIRDAETAEIAIRAAMTGHLVLSSLHTRDAKGAIYRLLEFGINHEEIEQTLLAVSAQRLVTLLCPFCGQDCSKYCIRKEYSKRVGVYEILYGHALQNILRGNDSGKYETIHSLMRKGMALGFISYKEYRRWNVEGEITTSYSR